MSDKIQTTDNGQLDPKENPNAIQENESLKADSQSAENPSEEQAEISPQLPEEAPGEKPEVTPEEVPTGLPEEQPAAVPEEKPVEVPGEMPEEVPQEAPPDETPVEKPGTASEDQGKEMTAEDDDDSDDEKEDEKDEDLVKQLNTLDESSRDQDDEEEEEEEEEEEVEHEEPVEKYEDFSREELLAKLEEVVAEEDVQKIKTRVALIKVAFLKLSREEQQRRLDEYLKQGGSRETYAPETDPLMERFDQAFDIYKKNKARFNEQQEILKMRNLDAKKQILEELKELISSEESLKKTYDRFKELQSQWKEIGLVPSTEINNLWQNYHFLVEKFFDKVKISKELRDLDLKKNMEMKVELCEKAEELLLEPSNLKSFKQLQKYHEEWKEIGPVPADLRDEIWERFKTATDKINERRRDHYNSLAQQREENLKKKNELCDQAEQVVSDEANSIKEWQESTRKINDLFNEWKALGPAPKKDNDEVWERFKTYLNAFFSNKKEYFGKLKQEQLNNFNLKLDICKQAEALKDSTDWRDTTRELIDLQKEWKNIGPVPRKHSDRIWKRFRAACDEFFQRKSEHFGSLQKNEKENLERKKELIVKLNGYEFGKNKSDNLQVLKDFQREWMEIGHVPIKEKDKIQKEFREAINQQMDALNIHSSEIRVHESRPRFDSGRDHGHGRGESSPARREMGFLTGKINQLREDIQLWENNIGFLANSKRADIVRKEFEEKIDNAKSELETMMAKLKELQEAED